MLKRIKIQDYKSFAELDVSLDSLTVLFGPNGSGKSNFLDALRLLSRLATSRTVKEAFDPLGRGAPLESFAFGPRGLPGLLEQDSASFSIEADIELSNSTIEKVEREIDELTSSGLSNGRSEHAGEPRRVKETLLRYQIKIETTPRNGILRVADESLTALSAKGIPKKRKPYFGREEEKLRLRREGKQAHPTEHEIGLDHTLLSRPFFPPHYPHLTALRRELEGWSFFYLEPRERMRAPNPVKETRHIGLMGEDLAAYLNTLRALKPRQFEAVASALRMMIPSVSGLDVGVNGIGEAELRVFEDGAPFSARLLSEGTLRLLGLLAIGGAGDVPTLVGFEEPENGIHPRRIRQVAEYLKTQAEGPAQIIVTTHSPALLDEFPPESLYLCRKLDRSTRIERFEPVGRLFRLSGIDAGLDDESPAEDVPKISDRLLRGDFDA